VKKIKQQYNFTVFLAAFVCLTTVIAILSCQPQHLRRQVSQEGVSFWTPSGNINEGYSMAEVVAILGHPQQVDTRGRFELWEYNFNKQKKLYVVFEKGALYWVKFEQEP